MPTVSIVLPVYNTAAYLPACLESLCAQTLRDLEIIAVDDGSTDGSANVLKERSQEDPRIRVIQQPNGGVSRARNAGMAASTGSYLLFVDSDDYLEPFACEHLVARAEQDGADIVVFGGDSFPAVPWINRAMSTRNAVLHDSFAALFGEVGSYPLMCNKLYRRELLAALDLRFNEGLSLGEDHAFQMCVFPHAATVSFTSASLYHYRCGREGSAMETMRDSAAAKAANHLALVEYVLETWNREGWLAPHRAEMLKWSCDLLEQDFPHCTYVQRAELAPRYRALVDAYDLASNLQVPYLRRSVRFFGGADLAATAPLVSVVVADDGEEGDAGFLSLSNQSFQSLELLCIAGERGEARLARWQGLDPRVREVASAADGLAQARGRYVLFARSRNVYAWDALGSMMEALEQARAHGKDPQLATIRDVRDVLRCEELGRTVQAATGAGWISASLLGDRVLSFASLSSVNKLWLTSYVRELALDPQSVASMARALSGVRELCPCDGRLVELGEMWGPHAEEAAEFAAQYAFDLDALRNELQLKPAPGAPECGVNRVLLGGLMGRAELLEPALWGAYFAAVRGALVKTDVLADVEREQFAVARDYDDACDLLRIGAEAFAETYAQRRVSTLAAEHDVLREELAFVQARLNGRLEQLEAIQASASFKVGRAATSIPRALRSGLKGVPWRR